MQEVGSLLEVLQRYFKQDIIVMMIIAALPWLIKSFSKKQKLLLSGVVVGILLLFNSITFWFMNKLGENETYYRFFWALPCGCILAFLLVKLWELLKDKWQKVAVVLILAILAFMHSDTNISSWMPRDLWYLSEETMQLAELIEADSNNDIRSYLYDYSDLSYGIREYDANIIFVDDGAEKAFDNMFANNEGNVIGGIVCAVAINNNIEYVYIEKEKEDAQMSLMAGGASFVGETNAHKVYRFDLDEMQVVYDLSVSEEDNIEIFDSEYAHIPVEGVLNRFVYSADGNLVMLNEDNEKMNVRIAGDEVFEVLDLEKYYICSIDNPDGYVSAEVMEQFELLNQEGKPIVLFLSNSLSEDTMRPLEKSVLSEETKVSAVFVRGYDEVWRSKLPNGIVQCGCTVYMDTAIVVKGE